MTESSQRIHPAEDIVFACLEQDDVAAAIDRACAAHPEHAVTIRRVASRLCDLGLTPVDDGALERIGPFALRERIGQGGMGVVYRAWQEQPGREVALKVIRPELMHFEGTVARFQREIEASVKLSHPSIVPVYEVGTSDGVPWFSMGFVAGRSLANVIEMLGGREPTALIGADLASAIEVGPPEESAGDALTEPISNVFKLNWVEAVTTLIRQIAIALKHAHSRGVLHRDVKPSNIMLTRRGRALLLDFGLALTDEGQRLTQSNVMLGSLPYMPPEMLRGEVEVPDATLDVYSLGVTLYEILTLRSPFLGSTAERTRRNVTEADPTPPRRLNPSVPRDLEIVCLTAMAELPSQRYASMATLVDDLQRACDGLPISASRDTVVRRAARYYRRNRALILTSAAIVTILAIGVIVSSILYLRSERLREVAQTARDVATRTAYLASISGAEESIRAHHTSRAIEHLRNAPPELRGWEWRHLLTRVDLSDAIWLREPTKLRVGASGGSVVAVGTERALIVCDANTGEVLRREASLPVRAVSVSRDGSTVVWSDDERLSLLDLARGEVRHFASGKWSQVAFGPEGRRVAVADLSGVVRAYDVRSRKMLWFVESGDYLLSVAWSPDGKYIAAAGFRMHINLIDAERGKIGRPLRGHRGNITAIAFSPDSRMLASGAADRTVRLWSLRDGKPVGFPFVHDGRALALAFSPNGRELAVAVDEAIVRWSVLAGLRLGTLHGHCGPLRDVMWPARRSIVSVGSDATVRHWSPLATDVLLLRPNDQPVADVAVSPDGKLVASVSRNAVLRVFDIATRRIEYDGVPEDLRQCRAVAFEPSGRWLVVARPEFAVVLDVDGWATLARLKVRKAVIVCLDVSPDGSKIAAVLRRREGYQLGFFDTRTWQLEAQHDLPAGTPYRIEFTPDGRALAIGGIDGFGVWLIKADDGSGSTHLTDADCKDLAVDRAGERIAVATADGGTSVWSLTTGKVACVLDSGATNAVWFEPSGERLFSVGEDGTLRAWDDDHEFAQLNEARTSVTALTGNRDGTVVVIGDVLGSVRVLTSAPPDTAELPDSLRLDSDQ